MRRTRPLLAGALLALVTGCGGGAAEPEAAPVVTQAPVQVQQTPRSCPAPEDTGTFPDVVPADLPEPPGTTVTEVQDRGDGLTVVQFTTPISIRESVLFLIESMPAAGYTLARGDAENTEADAPFVKGDLRGVLRMIAVEECRTDWLMALATGAPGGGGAAPLLPPRPDASPLPFG